MTLRFCLDSRLDGSATLAKTHQDTLGYGVAYLISLYFEGGN